MDEAVHREVVELVKNFEGFRSHPYLCPAGYWTRGYGMRSSKNASPITQDEAERELSAELGRLQRKLSCDALNDYEIAALSSLAYNVGLTIVKKSGLYAAVTRGKKEQWHRLLLYTKAGTQRLRGLLRRRCAEFILAHGGDWRTWRKHENALEVLLINHRLAAQVGDEIIRAIQATETDRAAT